MKKIAIIPARGGSKRIPRKNIKDFLGKPIIAYSIEAAIQSELFDEVMVSTDDQEIAEISMKYGANVPFFRSKKNSNDMASTADVIKEVIEEYQKINKKFDYLCCIYPTAPFISSQKLQKSYSMLRRKKADSVIPVVAFSYPVQRSLQIKDGVLSFICTENIIKRSQDLKPAYHDAGQFYWCDTNSFIKYKQIFMPKSLPFVLSESEVQDIDNEEDWKIAEMKYKINKNMDY